MKYPVIRFKSLELALKELRPFIRNGEHLQTGKPFDRFGGLRSRELLANWLICVVANAVAGNDQFTFTSDPTGGDGIIYNSQTEEAWPTEHILVPKNFKKTLGIEKNIIFSIKKKINKGGKAYAVGKTLVVMLNSDGDPWYPNKVSDELPAELHFDAVWVVGLQCVEDGEYSYNVARLDRSHGNAPVWRVHINQNFEEWVVDPIQ